jgi:anaerobic ribonucleoside-triphosphate reductase activating protein
MRIAGIVRDSIVDGVGVRDVIFLQGCMHHCEGCHNPHTWNTEQGEPALVSDIMEMLETSTNDVTISGGEPLLQLEDVLNLMRGLREFNGKRIWLYTGFTYEELPLFIWEILSKYVDVVVDGKFVKELADTNLKFRGSSNQRLIDLPKTVIEQKIILWEDSYEKE